jgi:hypothetical protein
MKKHIRIAAAILLSGILAVMTGPLAAFATDNNTVDFDREAEGGKYWSYIGVKTYGDLNDLFGEVTKELAPGDGKTVVVQLRNSSDTEAAFWLKAEALTGDGAKALESSFADKKALDDLLANISIEVHYKDALIYAGTLDGVGTSGLYSETGVLLGTLNAGNYGEITATLKVSEDLDNGYFDSLCAVRWLFAATQEDPEEPEEPEEPVPGDPGDPGDPGGPGGGPGPSATIPEDPTPLDEGPLTEIDDYATPLGELPEDTDLVVIADPETPLALPQTGGLMTYATPAALALAVLIALYAATYIRGRKKSNKGTAGQAVG